MDSNDWTIDWIGGKLGKITSDEPLQICAHFNDTKRPIFDLASITKVAVTGTLMAEIFVESTLSLEAFFNQTVVTEIPELSGTALQNTSLGELWEHRSGLQAHRLLFSSAKILPLSLEDRRIFSKFREDVWARFISELKDENLTTPLKTIYSDLGLLLLGFWIERKRGKSLDKLFEIWKLKHGLANHRNLRYGVSAGEENRVVPTESRHARGEVNDDNAYCMGGVAPHAGLFGSVRDVWAWLEALYRWGNQEAKLANEWLTPRAGIERFHAGWDTPSLDSTQISQAGWGAPAGTLGHLGYTGTAVWWNFKTRQAGVLLSNRVRPADTMQNRALIRQLRQEFFKDLWHNKSLGGESWKAAISTVG